MAQTGTQTSKVASELVSGPVQSGTVLAREALNHHPSVLAARELIQEARQQVARSHQLIERGRLLRQRAEETMKAHREHHNNL